MPFLPNHDTRLARLLGAIARGEQLAHRTAARQAGLVGLAAMRRALETQARQEHVHATSFAAAALLFDSRGGRASTPLDLAFDAYARELDADLAAGRLAASLVGLQGVLEGLGEALLTRLDAASEPRTAAFDALRRRFARQEHAHQAIGARCLRALGTGAPELREFAGSYAVLSEALIAAGADTLCSSTEQTASFLICARAATARWIDGVLA
jgi:hypothetical protein